MGVLLLNGSDHNGQRAQNAADPTADQDLATKKYIDSKAGVPTGKNLRAWFNGTQNISSQSVTQIQLASVASNDDAAYFTFSTTAYRATVLKPGLYLIAYYAQVIVSAYVSIFPRQNGTTLQEASVGSAGNGGVRLSGATTARLATNDIVDFCTYMGAAGQVSGSAAKDVGFTLTFLGT